MPFLKRNATAAGILRLLLHFVVHPVQMGFQRIVEPGEQKRVGDSGQRIQRQQAMWV